MVISNLQVTSEGTPPLYISDLKIGVKRFELETIGVEKKHNFMSNREINLTLLFVVEFHQA